MDVFTIKDLTYVYPTTNEMALENLSFTIDEGAFVLVGGASGSGKTTLLKLLKKEVAPFGEIKGEIIYRGTNLVEVDEERSAKEIGFVPQNPEAGIISDKVWHELAFGLENLGVPTKEIRRRVGEMASFFGMEAWFQSDTATLSGGQKQMLNLASVMVMRPKILLLDEPVAQLDPIASERFLEVVRKINRELGVSIVMTAHTFDPLFADATKVIILDKGRLIVEGKPTDIPEQVKSHPIQKALPLSIQTALALGEKAMPLSIAEGKKMLSQYFEREKPQAQKAKLEEKKKKSIHIKNVSFRYSKNTRDILKNLDVTVFENEILCLFGGNGSGKTTLLHCIAGLRKPYEGTCKIAYQTALLPQNPQTMFLHETVEKDLYSLLGQITIEKTDFEKKMNQLVEQFGVRHLLGHHPYDLSGGEQQKCALIKLLLSQTAKNVILLLDEPSKGLDYFAKDELIQMLLQLREQGIMCIITSHDVEFGAKIADRCGLLFDGEIISIGEPSEFFSQNYFYTTTAHRLSEHLFSQVITQEELLRRCEEVGANETD